MKIEIEPPPWVDAVAALRVTYASREDRMDLAVALARRNVAEAAGGPFGAVVFEAETGRVVSAGVNLVLPQRNSVLHAEVVAIMLAEARLGSYSLGAVGLPVHELVASCEPCAMCLGAVFWSGVRRLVCGAAGDDARAVGFDEGPVFAESFVYLERNGIEVVRGVRRDEARAVLELYVERGGRIYNR